MGAKPSLEDTLIELKLSAKQMTSAAKKAEKEEKKARNDVKKAIEKGNTEGARIYAQNAIRNKQQSLNYLKLSSRIDGVAARLDTAIRTNGISNTMQSIVAGMHNALASMDVESISTTMDEFERQFEDMDVRAAYMEGAMNSSTAMSTPQEDVDNLITMVADEHQLDLSFALDDAGAVGSKAGANAQPAATEGATAAVVPAGADDEGDLAARLAALRK
jgi:charged multivesicular body protein 1